MSLNDNSRGNYYICPTQRGADMPEELGRYPYTFLSPTLANLLHNGCSRASEVGELTKRLLVALFRTVFAVLQFTITESMGLLTMNMMGNAVHHQIVDKELEKAMDLRALGLQDANGDPEKNILEEVEMISGPIMRNCSEYSNDQELPNHARIGKTSQREAEGN